jgi:hypothetical protein
MNKKLTQDVVVERVGNPAGFYEDYASELEGAGAAAFGQPAETFGKQVAERFTRATLAQVMRVGGQIAGFALYDRLRSRHWQCALY